MNDNKLNADNSIYACKKQLIVSVPDHKVWIHWQFQIYIHCQYQRMSIEIRAEKTLIIYYKQHYFNMESFVKENIEK